MPYIVDFTTAEYKEAQQLVKATLRQFAFSKQETVYISPDNQVYGATGIPGYSIVDTEEEAIKACAVLKEAMEFYKKLTSVDHRQN